MANKSKNKAYDPTEKVERMNRIFDQVVLPAIIFTVIMFIVTAFILKPSCGVGDAFDELVPVENDSQQNLDPYLMREVLLEDLEGNRSIFERGGYTMVETEQSGLVAYCQLDEHTQIFDNVADSSGSHYSAIMYEKDGLNVTLRIYSDSIFLVETSDGTRTLSAIFRDDEFTTWTSGSDADAGGILTVVSARQLSELVGQYKDKIISLVNAD